MDKHSPKLPYFEASFLFAILISYVCISSADCAVSKHIEEWIIAINYTVYIRLQFMLNICVSEKKHIDRQNEGEVNTERSIWAERERESIN